MWAGDGDIVARAGRYGMRGGYAPGREIGGRQAQQGRRMWALPWARDRNSL